MPEEGIPRVNDELVEKEEETNRVVPSVIPSRRSKRLEEKRGGQCYQSGLVTDTASKRKALLTKLDTGIVSDEERLQLSGGFLNEDPFGS